MRRRTAVLGGMAVAVLVIAAVLVALTHHDAPTPEERAAAATSSARSWLGAWSADDRGELRALLARRTATLGPTLDEFRGVLRVTRLRAVARPARLVGQGATVPFDAQVRVGEFGTWRYRGALALVEGDHGWRVRFTPAALHPDLVDGQRLEVVSGRGARGRLLYADAAPLTPTPELRSVVGTVAGDAGTAGLQKGFDAQLGGTPSAEVRLLRGDEVVGIEASFEGTAGHDVRTTLDPRALAAARTALGTEGNAAALVAIQPSTGAIRAIANRPGNGYDRALLEHGVTPATRISCPKEITVSGRTIRNAEDEELGDISFADAFAHSCNTAFIQLAQQLQGADVASAAKSLGFGVEPAIGIPAPAGSYPAPHSTVDLVSSAIGQGRVLATPLQMATVAASIAAGGFRHPHLEEVATPPPLEPLPDGVAATMQELMRRVVSSGTGKKARLPGTPVAGKTGTAEFGTTAPLHTHAWFVAFRGDLAVAVIVEDGGFGGDAAAPIAADFFRRVG